MDVSASPSISRLPAAVQALYKDVPEPSQDPDAVAKRQAALARLAAQRDATNDPSKATSSAVLAAQADPTRAASKAITDTYADESLEKAALTAAAGAADTASQTVQSLNLGMAIYNAAARNLADQAAQDELRHNRDGNALQIFRDVMTKQAQKGLGLINDAQAALQANFQVSGDMAVKGDDGLFKAGAYTVTATGDGWSVAVDPAGKAKGAANGVDISDQLPGSLAYRVAQSDAAFAAYKAKAAAATAQPDAAVATSDTPAPASKAVTDTYAKGSPRSETVTMATGAAEIARQNMETINFGASIYNGATKELDNTEQLGKLFKAYGEKGLQLLFFCSQMIIRDGLSMMRDGQAAMNLHFKTSGPMLTKGEDGLFKPGQYTATAKGGGWSVEVKSTGEAKAVANGVDVSDQVSDSSSTGFKWSEQIARAKAAQAKASTGADVALATLKQVDQAYKVAANSLGNDVSADLTQKILKPAA